MTPREVSVRLSGHAAFMGAKPSNEEARRNADAIMALASQAGPVETVKVQRIIRLTSEGG